jgi:hypothetical protein
VFFNIVDNHPSWTKYCVVSRPGPGRECILDVALLGEGRSSNLGQGSEMKAAHSSNNFSLLDTWVFYYVLVSELQQDENSGGNVPLTSPQSSWLLDVLWNSVWRSRCSYVRVSKNYGKFWGYLPSKVLMLLDLVPRMIVPRRITWS